MNIDAREFVPKDSYNYCISKGIDPLILIDSRLITIYKTLKSFYPSIYVNDWHKGGNYSQSGFRNDPDTGSRLSQHRFGRALDIHGADNKVLYSHILKHKSLHYSSITAIESLSDTVGWIHIDVRTGQYKIVRG